MKCNHKDKNGKLTLNYSSIYEMRSSDMYCTQCGKNGSRDELIKESEEKDTEKNI